MTIKEALYAPLGEIRSRRGRGGTYDYVPWKNIADRMNEVFGIRWSSEVTERELIGNNVIVRVKVCVEDPETGHEFCQEGYGGAVNDESAEAGNPFKAAYSKAFKDACKKWGVGLYLEEELPTEPEKTITESVTPPGFMGKEYGVPPTSPPINDLPAADQFVPKPQTPVGAQSNAMPLPPGVSMGPSTKEVKAEITLIQEEPTPKVDLPKQNITPPPPPTSPQKVVLRDDMPMSKVTTINTGEPDTISDVQKAALQSILNMRGVDYYELVKEAFEVNNVVKDVIPEPDKLTYQEAVHVVKYGNDKFRKR